MQSRSSTSHEEDGFIPNSSDLQVKVSLAEIFKPWLLLVSPFLDVLVWVCVSDEPVGTFYCKVYEYVLHAV